MAIVGLPIDIQSRFSALCNNLEAYTLLDKYEAKVKELPWNHPLKKAWHDEITNLKVRLMNAFRQKDNISPTDEEVNQFIKANQLELPKEEYTDPKDWVTVISKEGQEALNELSDKHRSSTLPMADMKRDREALKAKYSRRVYKGK
jgi:hypothetical protein